jgi:hypothetical protein
MSLKYKDIKLLSVIKYQLKLITLFRKLYPGIFPRLMAFRQLHWIPGFKEMLLSTGCCAASKEGIEVLLR